VETVAAPFRLPVQGHGGRVLASTTTVGVLEESLFVKQLMEEEEDGSNRIHS
jgi:hypothetical protein